MSVPSENPSPPPASYDDIRALPEHMVGEIVDGRLYTRPRPAPQHALAASGLGMELGPPFQFGRGGGPGGWWIVDEPELHLGAQVLVPDLAGWRRERLPTMPDTAWFELAPDWVCEVLSPGSARHDRVRKMRVCAQHAVPGCWLLDPLARTLEVFTLAQGQWRVESTHEGEETVRAVPFEAVALALGDLWPPPPAGASE
jgi:hypothetical protein